MQRELLSQYEKDVINLRNCAKQLNFSDKEIGEIFEKCFKSLNHENRCSTSIKTKAQNYLLSLFKILSILATFMVCVYVLLNVHQATSSIVLRNVQVLIYPGLKVLRFLSVPVIKQFPGLTGYYDESCLVENPYFYVSDMECWPCENVHSVIDLTGFNNYSLYQSGVPYIVKTQQKRVTLATLRDLYDDNEDVFREQAFRVVSSNDQIGSLADMFELSSQIASSHNSWRINRMVPGRLVRRLFPRPYIVSEWSGQSIERYVMVDGPDAPQYAFPSLECGYTFVVQASGQQTVILKPSQECSNDCRTVSVILKTGYVLWYNWWYWRPISLPTNNSTELSISYISSYC